MLGVLFSGDDMIERFLDIGEIGEKLREFDFYLKMLLVFVMRKDEPWFVLVVGAFIEDFYNLRLLNKFI